MILDSLQNSAAYRTLSPEIALAFDYLCRTDFTTMPEGRYDLEGDRVYAIVQRYCPKPLAEAKWEAHRRYLDVQYLAEGVERMGYALLRDGFIIQKDYNVEKDVVFYKTEGDLLTLRAGSFAIFAPQDVHAPCLALDDSQPSAKVCKVVVKCRLSEG
jgi:YhcH/YjgK/YiaL family protein